MVELPLGWLEVARLDNRPEQTTRRPIGQCQAPTRRHAAPSGSCSTEFVLIFTGRTYGRAV